MERKAILELVIVFLGLALIVGLPLKVCFTETDTNLKLLAIGIILSAFLGGYNMFKLFKKDRMIELKEEELAIERERRKEEIQDRKKKSPY